MGSSVKHLVLGRTVCSLEILKREQNVLTDGHVRVECIVLENKSYASAFGGHFGYIVLTKENFAACGLLKSAYHVKRGTLSAA